jgi:hypothetical protein
LKTGAKEQMSKLICGVSKIALGDCPRLNDNDDEQLQDERHGNNDEEKRQDSEDEYDDDQHDHNDEH